MNDLKAIIIQAKTLIIQNELLKCELLLNKAIKLYPNSPELFYYRSYIYRKNTKYEEALIDLETAYKSIPPNSVLEPDIRKQIALSYNEMGMNLFQKKRFSECLTIFSEALKFKENDWGILINRGDSYEKLHDYKGALNDYEKALSEAGNKIEITVRVAHLNFLMGLEYFNKKQYLQAIEYFNKAVEFRGDFSHYFLIRGKSFYELNQLASALKDFTAALDLNEKNEEAKNFLKLIKKNSFQHMKNEILRE